MIILPFQTKYPAAMLKGKAIKRAVSAYLLEPVLAFGHHIFPFRVVWRVRDDQIAEAWDDIVVHRQQCDRIVAETPSLQMFVSCISGVYTRSTRWKPETGAGPVYPVVSYWAVFLGSVSDEGTEMLSRIRTACPRVQLKQITSLTRLKSVVPSDSICNPLYVVLKDHNSVFVNKKIACSLQPSEFHSHGPNAKLSVMSDSLYLPQIPACVEALQDAGLYMEADVLQRAPSPSSQA